MARNVDPVHAKRRAAAGLVLLALVRLRRWWSYRPERRYMRGGPGHAAR